MKKTNAIPSDTDYVWLTYPDKHRVHGGRFVTFCVHTSVARYFDACLPIMIYLDSLDGEDPEGPAISNEIRNAVAEYQRDGLLFIGHGDFPAKSVASSRDALNLHIFNRATDKQSKHH